jgi:predicted RecB family nuclease
MFTLKDFSNIFCCSVRTIDRRIIKIKPFFKKFDPDKRKHFYTTDEANKLIKIIGIPPNNEFNRQLADKYPELFK